MKKSEITQAVLLAMHRAPALRTPVAGESNSPITEPRMPAMVPLAQNAGQDSRTDAHGQIQPNTQNYDDHSDPGLPNTEHSQQAPALARNRKGKAQSTGCPAVRYTLCRVRLLDVDAKYASVKDTLDGLRIAGFIRGDKEGEITLEVEQVKVGSYAEERTEIMINYPAHTGS